jgi:hypothetical protein
MGFYVVVLHKIHNMSKIENSKIENFRSSDPQKYIVAVEGGYDKATVTLVINDRMRIKKWLNINLNLFYGLRKM